MPKKLLIMLVVAGLGLSLWWWLSKDTPKEPSISSASPTSASAAPTPLAPSAAHSNTAQSNTAQSILPQGYPAQSSTAELTAAIQGLKVIDQVQAQKGLILTDSEYVIKGVYDYSPKWIAQNWIKRDGEPVKNKELWQELIAHKQGLEAKGVHLEMKWVKGHAGELGNESADKLATRGRSYCGQFNEYPTDQVFYSMLPAAGYWSPKYDYNRFLFMPCWYFVTNTDLGQVSEDGRHIYLCGRHGSEDDQFGKRVADHSFAVMLLKEREPILDIVKDAQNAITPNGYSEICIAYVDSILTPRNALIS